VTFSNLSSVLAQQTYSGGLDLLGQHLLAALIFSAIGVMIFFAALLAMEKLTPFSIVKEIGDEHNTAVAIIVGAIIIGIAMIVSASVSG
jgi:putative membrane protein